MTPAIRPTSVSWPPHWLTTSLMTSGSVQRMRLVCRSAAAAVSSEARVAARSVPQPDARTHGPFSPCVMTRSVHSDMTPQYAPRIGAKSDSSSGCAVTTRMRDKFGTRAARFFCAASGAAITRIPSRRSTGAARIHRDTRIIAAPSMKRTDFAYELPPERIAQEPRMRGRSRLMVVGAGHIEHHTFDSFPNLLAPEDVLVINDTRVIPARLYAKPKGQMKNPIEFLLTRKLDELMWHSWCKSAKRVHVGDRVEFSEALAAIVMEKREDGTVVIRFEGNTDEIERIGVPPLPPYIAREQPRDSDRDAYQTVYASARGAIAAPTAGLHFTQEILDEIAARGIEIVRVTLHVGIGTFKPVKVDDVSEHRMDSERYEITPDT